MIEVYAQESVKTVVAIKHYHPAVIDEIQPHLLLKLLNSSLGWRSNIYAANVVSR